MSPTHLRKKRLLWVFTRALLGSFLLSILISGYISYITVDFDVAQEIEDQSISRIKFVAKSIASPYWQFEDTVVKDLATETLRHNYATDIKIFNERGNLDYHLEDPITKARGEGHYFIYENLYRKSADGSPVKIGQLVAAGLKLSSAP